MESKEPQRVKMKKLSILFVYVIEDKKAA